jgi:hypothetical protein
MFLTHITVHFLDGFRYLVDDNVKPVVIGINIEGLAKQDPEVSYEGRSASRDKEAHWLHLVG